MWEVEKCYISWRLTWFKKEQWGKKEQKGNGGRGERGEAECLLGLSILQLVLFHYWLQNYTTLNTSRGIVAVIMYTAEEGKDRGFFRRGLFDEGRWLLEDSPWKKVQFGGIKQLH